jgi:hypothetical protein
MTKINNCRTCKSNKIKSLFSLGLQSYTGIFSKKNSYVPKGKLTIIICENCKLVQLDKNFDEKKMYGKNYGYRTSLNKSMQKHIELKKNFLQKIIKLKKNDTVIDIGSNDGTFLNCFDSDKFKLIGVDPSIINFKKFYKKKITKINNFFSYKNVENYLTNNKAKLIEGSVEDSIFVEELFSKLKFPDLVVVIHASGLKFAGESVKDPLKFYTANTISTINLLKQMKKFNLNKLIFSSSSSVYGDTQSNKSLKEDFDSKPISPYGRSKFFSEQIIRDAASEFNLNSCFFTFKGWHGDHSPFNNKDRAQRKLLRVFA